MTDLSKKPACHPHSTRMLYALVIIGALVLAARAAIASDLSEAVAWIFCAALAGACWRERRRHEILTASVQEVLDIPNSRRASMAAAYRAAGHDIPADAEQAFLLQRFLPFAIRHGEGWKERAADDLDSTRAVLAEKRAALAKRIDRMDDAGGAHG